MKQSKFVKHAGLSLMRAFRNRPLRKLLASWCAFATLATTCAPAWASVSGSMTSGSAELTRTSDNVGGSIGGTTGSFNLTGGNIGVLDWHHLNLNQGEALNYSGAGSFYNVVNSAGGMSKIDGAINGTGNANVYIFNPNGVMMQNHAAISVEGIFGAFATGVAGDTLNSWLNSPNDLPAAVAGSANAVMSGDISVSGGAQIQAAKIALAGENVTVADGAKFTAAAGQSGNTVLAAGTEIKIDNIAGGDVSFTIPESAGAGDIDLLGDFANNLEAQAAGAINVNNGDLAAAGEVTLDAGGDVIVQDNGTVKGTKVTIAATGAVTVDGSLGADKATIDATAGDVSIEGAAVKIGDKAEIAATSTDDSKGNVTITATDVDDLTGKSVAMDGTANIEASGRVTIEGTEGDIVQGANAAIVAKKVSVTTADDHDVALAGQNEVWEGLSAQGKDVTLNGKGSLELGAVTAAGKVEVTADGNIGVQDGANVSAAGDVSLTAGNIVNVRGETGGDAGVVSTGGDITLAGGRGVRVIEQAVVKTTKTDGKVTLTATKDDVEIDAATVSATAGKVTLTASEGDIYVGTTDGEVAKVEAATVEMSAAQGDIEENATGKIIATGDATFTAESVTLGTKLGRASDSSEVGRQTPAANEFGGKVNATATDGDVIIDAESDIDVGTVVAKNGDTVVGDVSINAGKNLFVGDTGSEQIHGDNVLLYAGSKQVEGEGTLAIDHGAKVTAESTISATANEGLNIQNGATVEAKATGITDAEKGDADYGHSAENELGLSAIKGAVEIDNATVKTAGDVGIATDTETVMVSGGAKVTAEGGVSVDSQKQGVTVKGTGTEVAGKAKTSINAYNEGAVAITENAVVSSEDIMSVTAVKGNLEISGGAEVKAHGMVGVVSRQGNITVDNATVKGGDFDVNETTGKITDSRKTGSVQIIGSQGDVEIKNGAKVAANGLVQAGTMSGKLKINNATLAAGGEELSGAAGDLTVMGGESVTIENGAKLLGKGNVIAGRYQYGSTTLKSGAVTIDDASVEAEGDVLVLATGATTLDGTAKVGANGNVRVEGGSVAVGADALVIAAKNATVAATGTADADAATVSGTVRADAGSVVVKAANDVKLNAGSTLQAKHVGGDDGNILVEAGRDLTVGEASGAATLKAFGASDSDPEGAAVFSAARKFSVVNIDNQSKGGATLVNLSGDATVSLQGDVNLTLDAGDNNATVEHQNGTLTIVKGSASSAAKANEIKTDLTVEAHDLAGMGASGLGLTGKDVTVNGTSGSSLTIAADALLYAKGDANVNVDGTINNLGSIELAKIGIFTAGANIIDGDNAVFNNQGAVTFSAADGDVTLDSAKNQFVGKVNVTDAKTVTLVNLRTDSVDDPTLDLGNINVQGKLDATARDIKVADGSAVVAGTADQTGSVELKADYNITVQGGSVTANGDVTLDAEHGVSIGGIDTADSTVKSTAGAVKLDGAALVTVGEGGAVRADAGKITIVQSDADSSGATAIQIDKGTVAAAGDLEIAAAAGDIVIEGEAATGTEAAKPASVSGAAVAITATDGSVQIGDTANAGDVTTLTAAKTLTVKAEKGNISETDEAGIIAGEKATFTALDVDVFGDQNDFQAIVDATATKGNVQIYDQNQLELGQVSATKGTAADAGNVMALAGEELYVNSGASVKGDVGVILQAGVAEREGSGSLEVFQSEVEGGSVVRLGAYEGVNVRGATVKAEDAAGGVVIHTEIGNVTVLDSIVTSEGVLAMIAGGGVTLDDSTVSAVGDASITAAGTGTGDGVLIQNEAQVQVTGDSDLEIEATAGDVVVDNATVQAGTFTVTKNADGSVTYNGTTEGNLEIGAKQNVVLQNGARVGASGTATVEAETKVAITGVNEDDATKATTLAANGGLTVSGKNSAKSGLVEIADGAEVAGNSTVTVEADSKVTVDAATVVAAGDLAAQAENVVIGNGARVATDANATIKATGSDDASEVQISGATVSARKALTVQADDNVHILGTEGHDTVVSARGEGLDADADAITIKSDRATVEIGGDKGDVTVTAGNADDAKVENIAISAGEGVDIAKGATVQASGVVKVTADNVGATRAGVTVRDGAFVQADAKVQLESKAGDVVIDNAKVKAGDFTEADPYPYVSIGNLVVDAARNATIENGATVGASGTADIDAGTTITVRGDNTKVGALGAMTLDAATAVAVQDQAVVAGLTTVTVGGGTTPATLTVDDANVVAGGELKAYGKSVTVKDGAKVGSDSTVLVAATDGDVLVDNATVVATGSAAVQAANGTATIKNGAKILGTAADGTLTLPKSASAMVSAKDVVIDNATVRAGGTSVGSDGIVVAEAGKSGTVTISGTESATIENDATIAAKNVTVSTKALVVDNAQLGAENTLKFASTESATFQGNAVASGNNLVDVDAKALTVNAAQMMSKDGSVDVDATGKILVDSTDAKFAAEKFVTIDGTDEVEIKNISQVNAANVRIANESAAADKDVTIGGDVTAAGNVTIIAARTVKQNANLTALNGSAYVEAKAGDIIIAAGKKTSVDGAKESTVNGNVLYRTDTGTIKGDGGDVTLESKQGIVKIDTSSGTIGENIQIKGHALIAEVKEDGGAISGNLEGNVDVAYLTSGDVSITHKNGTLKIVDGASYKNLKVNKVLSEPKVEEQTIFTSDADVKGITANNVTIASGDGNTGNTIIQEAGADINAQGVTTLEAKGDIVLDNAGNDFVGKVNASTTDGSAEGTGAGKITLRDANDLKAGTVAASDKVTLSAVNVLVDDGSVSATAGGVLLDASHNVDVRAQNGAASVTAAAGDITLKGGAAVTVADEGVVAATDGDVTLHSLDQAGAAAVTVDGATVRAAGTVTLEADKGDVTVKGYDTAVKTQMGVVQGDKVVIKATDGDVNLTGESTLGTAAATVLATSAAADALTVTASDYITEDSTFEIVSVGGASFTALDIDISSALNDFAYDGDANLAKVNATATEGNIVIGEKNTIRLGVVEASGYVTVDAGEDIRMSDSSSSLTADNATLNAATIQIEKGAKVTVGSKLLATAVDDIIVADGAQIEAAGTDDAIKLEASSGGVEINGDNAAASEKTLVKSTVGNVLIQAGEGIVIAKGAQVEAAKDAKIVADNVGALEAGVTVRDADTLVKAGGDVRISAETGNVTVKDKAALVADNDDSMVVLNAERADVLVTGQATVDGDMVGIGAGQDSDATAGNVTVSDKAEVRGKSMTVLAAKDDVTINDAKVKAGVFDETEPYASTVDGTLMIGGKAVTIENAAKVGANDGVDVDADVSVTVQGSNTKLVSGTTLTVDAPIVTVQNGANIAAMDKVTLTAPTLTLDTGANVESEKDVNLVSTGTATIQGGARVGSDANVDIDANVLNVYAATVIAADSVDVDATGKITVDSADANFKAGEFVTIDGLDEVEIKSIGGIAAKNARIANEDAATPADVTIGGDVTADGNITIIAKGSVNQNADLSAGNDVATSGGGSVYVEAKEGSIILAKGVESSAAGSKDSAVNGNILYKTTSGEIKGTGTEETDFATLKSENGLVKLESDTGAIGKSIKVEAPGFLAETTGEGSTVYGTLVGDVKVAYKTPGNVEITHKDGTLTIANVGKLGDLNINKVLQTPEVVEEELQREATASKGIKADGDVTITGENDYITQEADAVIDVAGVTLLTVTKGDDVITPEGETGDFNGDVNFYAQNKFGDKVNVTTAENVTLNDADELELGNITVNETLKASAVNVRVDEAVAVEAKGTGVADGERAIDISASENIVIAEGSITADKGDIVATADHSVDVRADVGSKSTTVKATAGKVRFEGGTAVSVNNGAQVEATAGDIELETRTAGASGAANGIAIGNGAQLKAEAGTIEMNAGAGGIRISDALATDATLVQAKDVSMVAVDDDIDIMDGAKIATSDTLEMKAEQGYIVEADTATIWASGDASFTALDIDLGSMLNDFAKDGDAELAKVNATATAGDVVIGEKNAIRLGEVAAENGAVLVKAGKAIKLVDEDTALKAQNAYLYAGVVDVAGGTPTWTSDSDANGEILIGDKAQVTVDSSLLVNARDDVNVLDGAQVTANGSGDALSLVAENGNVTINGNGSSGTAIGPEVETTQGSVKIAAGEGVDIGKGAVIDSGVNAVVTADTVGNYGLGVTIRDSAIVTAGNDARLNAETTVEVAGGTVRSTKNVIVNANDVKFNSGAAVTAEKELVDVNAANSIVVGKAEITAAEKHVDFDSEGTITVNDEAANFTAGEYLWLDALGSIEIKKAGLMAAANVRIANEYATEAKDVTISGDVTASGNLTIIASGSVEQNANLKAEHGSVYVSAKTGHIALGDDVTTAAYGPKERTDSGNVLYETFTADGWIKGNSVDHKASMYSENGVVALKAQGGEIGDNIKVTSALLLGISDGKISGSLEGDIHVAYKTSGDVDITHENGTLTIADASTFGTLYANKVETTATTTEELIQDGENATHGITAQNVTIKGVNDTITQDIAGEKGAATSASIDADRVTTLTSSGTIDLRSDENDFQGNVNITTTGDGDVTLKGKNQITLDQVTVQSGELKVEAVDGTATGGTGKGDINFAENAMLTAGGDTTLTAENDVNVDENARIEVNAQKLTLTAENGDVNVKDAAALVLTAQDTDTDEDAVLFLNAKKGDVSINTSGEIKALEKDQTADYLRNTGNSLAELKIQADEGKVTIGEKGETPETSVASQGAIHADGHVIIDADGEIFIDAVGESEIVQCTGTDGSGNDVNEKVEQAGISAGRNVHIANKVKADTEALGSGEGSDVIIASDITAVGKKWTDSDNDNPKANEEGNMTIAASKDVKVNGNLTTYGGTIMLQASRGADEDAGREADANAGSIYLGVGKEYTAQGKNGSILMMAQADEDADGNVPQVVGAVFGQDWKYEEPTDGSTAKLFAWGTFDEDTELGSYDGWINMQTAGGGGSDMDMQAAHAGVMSKGSVKMKIKGDCVLSIQAEGDINVTHVGETGSITVPDGNSNYGVGTANEVLSSFRDEVEEDGVTRPAKDGELLEGGHEMVDSGKGWSAGGDINVTASKEGNTVDFHVDGTMQAGNDIAIDVGGSLDTAKGGLIEFGNELELDVPVIKPVVNIKAGKSIVIDSDEPVIALESKGGNRTPDIVAVNRNYVMLNGRADGSDASRAAEINAYEYASVNDLLKMTPVFAYAANIFPVSGFTDVQDPAATATQGNMEGDSGEVDEKELN